MYEYIYTHFIAFKRLAGICRFAHFQLLIPPSSKSSHHQASVTLAKHRDESCINVLAIQIEPI